MKLIVFTTLYPNQENPQHGIFIRRRLLEIQKQAPGLSIEVIAPVPWAPPFMKAYAAYRAIPKQEIIDGITVHHPRYVVIPKFGMHLTPHTLALACRALLKRIATNDSVLDAHYYYPDGVAAAALAKECALPLTISARGSDITLIAKDYPRARTRITAAARYASANIAVAEALAVSMRAMGMLRVHTLRNGVDTEVFKPMPVAKTHYGLSADTPMLCAVGNLVASKGQAHVIAALPELPKHHLFLAGLGDKETALRAQAAQLGVAKRVHFLGRLGQEDLRRLLSTSDTMVLASAREGWPNVVLEALACGCPAVATRVGAVPDMLTDPRLGAIVTADAIADAINKLNTDRAFCVTHAEGFAWAPVAKAQLALYAEALASKRNKSLGVSHKTS